MQLIAEFMEFRGLTKKTTKSGNLVYNANFETEESEHIEFYLGQDISLFRELDKGTICHLCLEYNPVYKSLRINDFSTLNTSVNEADELPFH